MHPNFAACLHGSATYMYMYQSKTLIGLQHERGSSISFALISKLAVELNMCTYFADLLHFIAQIVNFKA